MKEIEKEGAHTKKKIREFGPSRHPSVLRGNWKRVRTGVTAAALLLLLLLLLTILHHKPATDPVQLSLMGDDCADLDMLVSPISSQTTTL